MKVFLERGINDLSSRNIDELRLRNWKHDRIRSSVWRHWLPSSRIYWRKMIPDQLVRSKRWKSTVVYGPRMRRRGISTLFHFFNLRAGMAEGDTPRDRWTGRTPGGNRWSLLCHTTRQPIRSQCESPLLTRKGKPTSACIFTLLAFSALEFYSLAIFTVGFLSWSDTKRGFLSEIVSKFLLYRPPTASGRGIPDLPRSTQQ